MSITIIDIIKWENEKDLEKIPQFLMSNWEKKDKPLISYAINVLEKIHAPESLRYIITLNQDLFNKDLSFQIRDVLVNWGEPVIEYLFAHITSSKSKFDAVKALYTLGKIDNEMIIPKILEIIHKNINSLEKDACKILQKKISFSNLVDLFKISDEFIRYALVKTAVSYPFDFDKPDFPIPNSFYAFFEEEILYEEEIPGLRDENHLLNEEIKSNVNEKLSFTSPDELFDFFGIVLQDEHVQVRFAGIQGLRTEIENAKNEWFWRNTNLVFPFVRKILLHSIDDEDFYIQQLAVELLKNFSNDEEIYIELKKIFLQKEPLILEQLIATLGEFKKEEMFEGYLEVYKNIGFSQNIRSAALSAISKIPSKKSEKFLLKQNLTGISEKYLIEIVESMGFYSAQDSFEILLPFLDSRNMDLKITAIKSIAQQNDQVWKEKIISFISKNDNPIFLYYLIDYLRTFSFEQAIEIIIKHVVNTKFKVEITDYMVILQRLIGEESLRSHVSKIDRKNDTEFENDIKKFLSILDSRKSSGNDLKKLNDKGANHEKI